MHGARAAIGLAAVLAVGALGVAAAWSQTAVVAVRDNTFEPKTVTVRAGEDVVWRNEGTNPHTVTADGRFDSHPTCPSNIATCMKPGETYTVTFGSPGTYAYFCKIHRGSGMTGTVVVEGPPPGVTTTAPAPTTTARPAPTTTARPAGATTTTAAPATTTTTTTASTTSTTEIPFSELESTTTSPDGGVAAGRDDEGSGGQITLLIAAVLLSMALGAAAVWRFRPNRESLPPT